MAKHHSRDGLRHRKQLQRMARLTSGFSTFSQWQDSPHMRHPLAAWRTAGSNCGQSDGAQYPLPRNRAAVPRQAQKIGSCAEAGFSASANGRKVHNSVLRACCGERRLLSAADIQPLPYKDQNSAQSGLDRGGLSGTAAKTR